jgi:hypothetical protein
MNKRFGIVSLIVETYRPELENSIDDTPNRGLARSRSGFIGDTCNVPLYMIYFDSLYDKAGDE